MYVVTTLSHMHRIHFFLVMANYKLAQFNLVVFDIRYRPVPRHLQLELNSIVFVHTNSHMIARAHVQI